MELITIFLTGLMAMFSASGAIAEQRIETAIRDRVAGVEYLGVRIDNRPNHTMLRGSIDRIRIASQGLYLIEEVRIETLEVETDPLVVNLRKSAESDPIFQPIPLREPLQLALHLVITESDLKTALQSPVVQSYLENLLTPLPESLARIRDYRLLDFDMNFYESNRLQINVQLEPVDTDKENLDILIDFGIVIKQGRTLELIEPVATVNQRKVSTRFLERQVSKLNKVLDLKQLESEGIISRILQLEIREDQLDLAAFVRLEQLPEISVE